MVDEAVGDAAAKGSGLRSVSGCWWWWWLVVLPLGPLPLPVPVLSLLLLLLPPPPLSSPCNCCKGIAESRFSRQTMHWSAITEFNFEWYKGIQDDQMLEKAWKFGGGAVLRGGRRQFSVSSSIVSLGWVGGVPRLSRGGLVWAFAVVTCSAVKWCSD